MNMGLRRRVWSQDTVSGLAESGVDRRSESSSPAPHAKVAAQNGAAIEMRASPEAKSGPRNHAICWGSMLRLSSEARRAAGVYCARSTVVLDLALIADLLVDGHELVAIPTVAYRYRRHHQSQTALLTATAERFAEEAAIHRLLSQQAGDLDWPRSQRMATLMPSVRLHAAYRGAASLAHGRFTDARRTLATVRARR